MKSMVLIFFALLFAIPSFGAEQVNFFWQAPEGQVVFTPGVRFITLGAEQSIGTSDATSYSLDLRAEYGFSENLSVGLSIPYNSSEIEFEIPAFNAKGKYDYSGLSDWTLFLKSFTQADKFTFRYGVDLAFSLEDKKEDANGRNTNEYSGGTLIDPYVGFDVDLNSFFVGMRLAREINLGDRTIDEDGVKINSSGGEETRVTIFGEMHCGSHQYGTSLAYRSVEDVKNENSLPREQGTTLTFEIYGNFKLTPTIDIQPSLGYVTLADKTFGGVTYSKFEGFQGGLLGRFYF